MSQQRFDTTWSFVPEKSSALYNTGFEFACAKVVVAEPRAVR
jgi:hypothetical protein